MKRTWIRTAGIIVLAGLMTAGLDAQPGYRGGKGNGQGRGLGPCGQAFGSCCDSGQAGDQFQKRGGPGFALDLTEEQQEQMKALRLEHYKEMKPLKNQMAELKAREKTLIAEENSDMKAINSVIDNETELLNKIKKLQAGHRIAVRDILTEEQLMKFEQGMNFRGHHRVARGSRPGPGPGNV